MSETETRQHKARKCFASVNRDPVDKEAIQEGNLLGNALPATVDTADLLSPSRHPEEQPLDMAAGFSKATKDQALAGQGVHVRLQGADLACRCRVVGSIDGVELGLGNRAEPLGPNLNGLGTSRSFAVALA